MKLERSTLRKGQIERIYVCIRDMIPQIEIAHTSTPQFLNYFFLKSVPIVHLL